MQAASGGAGVSSDLLPGLVTDGQLGVQVLATPHCQPAIEGLISAAQLTSRPLSYPGKSILKVPMVSICHVKK